MTNRQSRYQRVLVPVDGSGWAERAVTHAVDVARSHGSTIVLLHVYTSPAREFTDQLVLAGQSGQMDEVRAQIEQYMAGVCAELRLQGIESEGIVIEGTDVPASICAYVEKAKIDLVVMSSHGRSGLARLLFGSVARAVMECLFIPVLLVSPDKQAQA
jgi:nucleotide-binding universal stress UspA family protein